MNPTLYDILGVSPDASREEIRAAWRAAADRFEPGEGGSGKQFRLFNEAAEVLLDPERRAEYDAQIGESAKPPVEEANVARNATDTGPAADDQPVDAAPGVVPGPPMPGAARATTAVPQERVEPESSRSASRRVPWVVFAPLAVVTALVIGVAAYLTVEANETVAHERALDRAPAAAENAAIAVLAYDHESLEADRDAAAKFLTPAYREDYVETFDSLVAENAAEAETSVEAEVLASSAMTVSGEQRADRVNVLLFVNQTTTSAAAGDPSVALNRVRFEMVEVDGTWLVDDITSY